MAAINIGVAAQLTVKPDPGDLVNLPVTVTICQTNQAGACIAPSTPTVNVTLAANATASFAVFVTATGPVPFKPDAERIPRHLCRCEWRNQGRHQRRVRTT